MRFSLVTYLYLMQSVINSSIKYNIRFVTKHKLMQFVVFCIDSKTVVPQRHTSRKIYKNLSLFYYKHFI